MIGCTLKVIGIMLKRQWHFFLMALLLWYCIWMFASMVDAHLATQMNLWSQNLGM